MHNKPLSLKVKFVAAATLALGITASTGAQAGYTIGEDHTKLTLGGLLQAWTTTTKDGAPDGSSMDTEFYLRRIRLMTYGELNEHVNFFIETDNPNLGKNGNWGGSMFIQDAYVELTAGDEFQLDAGLLLVPFSHHGMQGATSLLGLDYMSSVIRYPNGGHLVWRDGGLMVRGLVMDKRLEYRLGVFNGVRGNSTPVDPTDPAAGVTDPRNPKDYPRVAGRITVNVFEPEGGSGVGGMFYDGLYIKETPEGIVSTKKVLSVGGSFDWQKAAVVNFRAAPATIERKSYSAFAGDVFWDIPLNPSKLMSLNGQVNFYYYNHGDRTAAANPFNSGSNFSGIGLMSELGVRYDALAPVFQVAYFKAKDADADNGNFMGVYGGLNYWLYGHNTSAKIRVGSEKANGADSVLSGQLQVQLLF